MDESAKPPLIAHVIHRFDTGGLENGLVNIINRMPESHYRHAIVCLTESGSFEKRIEKNGVPIVALQARAGHNFGLYWRLWKTLKALGPAIVHTRNLSALEGQIPAFFLRRVRSVHGVHGRDVFDLDGQNRKYNLLRKLIRPLVGRYITVSQDLKNWLQQAVGVSSQRIVQIYNGVDRSIFSPRQGERPAMAPTGFLPSDPIVLGTVGRLAAVKDQKTMLLAFDLVLQRYPEWRGQLRMMVAGDGPQRAQLEALIEEKALGDLVWLAGDRDDIQEFMRLLDLFVLPSLGEGISNTILEAMATGLPIVATRVGGNPELVEEGVNGYLVPRSDPERMADAMARLIGSEQTRSAFGQASLKWVEQSFTWEKTVAAYQAVYDELLGRERQ